MHNKTKKIKIVSPKSVGATKVSQVVNANIEIGNAMRDKYQKTGDRIDAKIAVSAYRNAIWATRCQIQYNMMRSNPKQINFLES